MAYDINIFLGTVDYSRDTSKDIIVSPATLYTASTTLVVGMTLHNNNGDATEYTIGTVIDENSFSLESTPTIKSYSITYDETAYTATPEEGYGLVISNATNSIVNLGSDFEVTEL